MKRLTALLALALASPAAADSLRPLNPLDCARKVSLELYIGGPRSAEEDSLGLELFQGDQKRAVAARDRILAALTELLAKNGISVGPDGRGWAMWIFGRPVGGECSAQSVFTGRLSASFRDPD